MNQEIITQDGEIIEEGMALSSNTSMAVQLQKAEIDQLVSTARAYPRSLKRVQGNILSMATLDEESAEECIYALPRGGKPIRGPSIRFAEILKQSYGNCRAAARVIHVDKQEGYIEAEGVFHDLESNSASTSRVRRRITDKAGRVFKDDMIIVTGNAACSIAMRNAILAGVPKPLWRKAYDMVQATITGDITTLSENREKAFKALAAFGVKPEQVFQSLGIEGEEDITVDHIATLRGMYSALKNGEATVEEMFFGTLKAVSDHQKIDDPLSDKPIEQSNEKQEIPADASLSNAGIEGGEQSPSAATLDNSSAVDHLTDQDKISLRELITRLKSAVGDDPEIIKATAHSFNAAGFVLSDFAKAKARTITKHFISACTGELEATDAIALACGIAQIDEAEVQ
ncbi:hypothetical protein [Ochrobactrum sp. SFR4]|uniref:hypothetical protein n=1 Tax=Ochrobactrum sp. SFR4 TaxID=2717368 RepID=UPI001C8BF4FA|nr:hypothetical protein [Ochrobactrum sp. SFR4]MBX8825279.1 hypothetical protein [Ochrobactrum sp. SFR4]